MAEIIKNKVIFWFRRDLRLEDNFGLYKALSENDEVLPIFIFDTNILDKLEDRKDRRVHFIHQAITKIQKKLADQGATVLILHGDPVSIFKANPPARLYFNKDYEPYARERDSQVEKILTETGSEVFHFKDQVIFEKTEVVKDDGSPYSVFTPYSRKWKSLFSPKEVDSHESESLINKFLKADPFPTPSLNDLGFQETDTVFPDPEVNKEIIEDYKDKRDIPSVRGTSRLSVHIRFGTVSIRKLVKVAQKLSESWLNELIWREFYSMILWNHPHIAESSFKSQYDSIEWRNNEKEFDAWCQGKTGYPIVDAGMRELNQTGFMHNRVRMITASFLVKHLLIDWRWGEAYFGKKLLDYDLASNNGGWQWAAGSGCDAAPYFRVFNPELQTKKFDPDLKYIRKWVPEFQEPSYPKPIVEHKFARERALETYKKALSN